MKPRNLLFIGITTILSFALGVHVVAEETAKGKIADPVETDVFFEAAPALIVSPPGDVRMFNQEIVGGQLDGGTFSYVASEMSFGGTPVKGAPYSAEAVTETTQTLTDGNRIQRKNSASVYRDSEGRTRREQTLSAIGPWAAAGEPLQTISIHDPVASANFILNPKDKTARKMPTPPSFTAKIEDRKGTATGKLSRQIEIVDTTVAAPMAGVAIREVHRLDQNAPKPEPESLGNRVMEGVKAEGSRTTITIPAGEVGNELPISIVSETWFSPELQVVVLSKHNDPRMGETIYRLVNINRSEQPRSLFEVPGDFTVSKEAEANIRHFQMRKKLEGSGN